MFLFLQEDYFCLNLTLMEHDVNISGWLSINFNTLFILFGKILIFSIMFLQGNYFDMFEE